MVFVFKQVEIINLVFCCKADDQSISRQLRLINKNITSIDIVEMQNRKNFKKEKRNYLHFFYFVKLKLLI